ncbi:hypothetical protein OHB56_32910 [Streptomyces sp. NBC_01635]|uniref:hypothetical protein n=1 Tax=Streptomyces sp. NBC_01635 TaxID=2975904 RepID=UPI00386B2611|nr:hypothetical protein OHB56_32910 [Streptomyces sp. NBC_01635]
MTTERGTPNITAPQGPVISAIPASHRAALKQLSAFLRESTCILAHWDYYSEENTDLDGWPFDEHAYGLRQRQRDRETAEAFEAVRPTARQLLATAEEQLAQLPARALQPRWAWQLGTLRDALDRLDTLHQEWQQTCADLPLTALPGTPTYDDALADHDAEAWSYLDDWATHGHAVIDITTTARSTPSPLAPTAKPTLVADRTTPVRR